MRKRMAADEAKQERKRPLRIARKLCVMGITLGNGEMFQLCVLSIEVGLGHRSRVAS
jgi:hypothetical protein